MENDHVEPSRHASEPTARAAAWLTLCPAPALLVDPDGKVAGGNRALLEILPAARELAGRAFRDICIDHEVPPAHGELHLKVDGSDAPFDCYTGRLEGGWRTCVLAPRSQVNSRRLATQLATAETLARASSLEAAAPSVLEALCRAEGWSAGVLWRLTPSGDLVAASSWRMPELLSSEPLETLLGSPRPRLEETAGKLVGAYQPWWIGDLTHESDLRRASVARAAGLRSGCSLPISRHGELWAVLEMWSTREHHADPATLQHMSTVASQLGQFAQRMESDRGRLVSEGRLATVLANAPVVLFVFDENGRIEACTGAGIPEPDQWIGRNLLVELPAEDVVRSDLCRALAGESVVTRLESTMLAGRIFQIRYQPVRDVHGKVTGVIGVGLDVTEQRQQEAQLKMAQARELASERLVSLGTLAAGVAHEINNPLTYIQLNLGRLISLERAVTPPAPMTLHRLETLQEIREGVNHVAHIVRDLQAFSRARQEGEKGPQVADVETAIQAALRLADHEVRHRARVVREGDPVPAVRGAPERLAQLFLNLLLNAVQAIGDGDPEHNEVAIRTRQRAGNVEIEIRDTGCGIPPEVLPRIFDPFFTTKHGTGTGLGLFLSQDFVVQNGGKIDVSSQPGSGTRFTVSLPVAGEQPTEAIRPPKRASGRRGRVLVVDDDRGVAAAIAAFLGDHHEVRVAGSGREALTILRADTDFDAILCDLMMLDLTGMDVFDVLRQERPAMAERMIFMSAGATTERAMKFVDQLANPKIDKPLDLPRLLSLIDERVAYRHEWLATAQPPPGERSARGNAPPTSPGRS